MTKALGIDLGTTFSVVAVVGAGGSPEILRNREGENITPSVVLFQGDDVLVGSTAKRSVTTMPDECVQFIKRQMGDPHWKFVDSRGFEFRPEEISALILRRLVDDAEMVLGESIEDVVVTVPAYFDDARRKSTLDAGEIAGLRVLRLINEPTAAAVAYGVDEIERGTCLVFDLGGGTFDVTVMNVASGEFEVIATDGDRNLGGFDFDNELMKHVANAVLADGGPDLLDGGALESDLREKCELAKRTLSNVPQASVFVSAEGRSHRVQVTGAEFEEMTRHLLDRTEMTVEAVLAESGLGWDSVDRILLVGGSTRMPMVAKMLERLSGKPAESRINPDEAVALGSAIVADLTARELLGSPSSSGTPSGPDPVSITDVTSQSLGVLAVQAGTENLLNHIVIAKNSKIPCKRVQKFQTLQENQREWLLQVTEGDDPDPEYVTRLLQRPLTLPENLPKGSPMQVTMSYDVDGVVHVEITDLTTNTSLGEVELDRPLNLDRSDVDRMRAAMNELDVQ
ncbi:MAG: Hsp70 family protein [Propionibacteriales bacterium]|nr:Hsp70 family protein [Propionibacteriales bacterium]